MQVVAIYGWNNARAENDSNALDKERVVHLDVVGFEPRVRFGRGTQMLMTIVERIAFADGETVFSMCSAQQS